MNPGFGIKMNVLQLFGRPPVSSVFEFYLPISTKGVDRTPNEY